MPLDKYYPKRLSSFFDNTFFEFDSFFESFPFSMIQKEGTCRPRVVAREEKGHVIVEAELPGYTKEEVTVEIKEGLLSIEAEKDGKKKNRSFAYTATINKEIDVDKVTGVMENGILTLTIPVLADKKNGHQIQID